VTTSEASPDAASESIEAELFEEEHRQSYLRQILIVVAGIVAVIIAALISIRLGTEGASYGNILSALWARITFAHTSNPNVQQLRAIIWYLRMPRVGLAIFGGAALAVAGTLYQGLLRNPLVSPFTLGTAPAAAFGAALAILVFSQADQSGLPLVFGALVFAIGNTALVLLLASRKRLESTTLILLGIALTQLFGALTAGMEYFANQNVLEQIVQWTWGSVNDAVWSQAITLLVILVVFYPYVQSRSGALNAIAFAGDDAAKTLGVPVARLRLELIGIATVLTAVTISFTGIIGFVGLVGPHAARLIVGANHRFLLPFSAAMGAFILVVADIVGRAVLAPTVVPVGIIDALIGAPIFIYLVLARRGSLS
jgi:iron complex transport system permease protein